MDLDGNFTRLLSCSNSKNIYALEYSELLGSIVAVNISSDGRPGKVMLIDTVSIQSHPRKIGNFVENISSYRLILRLMKL